MRLSHLAGVSGYDRCLIEIPPGGQRQFMEIARSLGVDVERTKKHRSGWLIASATLTDKQCSGLIDAGYVIRSASET
jgi:hypothetical protein